MSLKALADKVLQRDSAGTKHGTDCHILSHGQKTPGQPLGTVIPFQDFIESIEERAGIMQFDAPDVHPNREAATAYEECRVIWLEKWRQEQ